MCSTASRGLSSKWAENRVKPVWRHQNGGDSLEGVTQRHIFTKLLLTDNGASVSFGKSTGSVLDHLRCGSNRYPLWIQSVPEIA